MVKYQNDKKETCTWRSRKDQKKAWQKIQLITDYFVSLIKEIKCLYGDFTSNKLKQSNQKQLLTAWFNITEHL